MNMASHLVSWFLFYSLLKFHHPHNFLWNFYKQQQFQFVKFSESSSTSRSDRKKRGQPLWVEHRGCFPNGAKTAVGCAEAWFSICPSVHNATYTKSAGRAAHGGAPFLKKKTRSVGEKYVKGNKTLGFLSKSETNRLGLMGYKLQPTDTWDILGL